MAFGLTGQILNIVMSFAARTVLIHTLGDLYAGIAGNFTNILMVFSLADLGVGTAIIYALYKPIAVDDKQKVRALMGLYAKAYRTIGLVIIGLGLATTPFIQHLMKTDAEIPHLKLIFMIYVVNTASTYFLAYKGTLITAHQKNYIVTNVTYLTSIVGYIVQIVILLTTRNYIFSLSFQVFINILQNIITMQIANRMYPHVKGRIIERLPGPEKKGIFRNMASMVFYRIGQVVLNGTDSIVISSMIGVIETGIYSNYNLLFTTIKNLMNQVFNAVTASLGNLNAMETDEKKYSAFNMVYFGSFWMNGFAAVCFWCLIDPFIMLWLGKTRVMDTVTVLLLVLNFYMLGMRHVVTTFRDTMGVFREGRFIPLLAAVLNIIISILLAKTLGMMGVFLGTTISIFLIMLWLEPVVLFRHGFKRSCLGYFGKYFVYLGITAAVAWGTKLLSDLLFGANYGVGTFVLRLLFAVIVSNAAFFAVSFWSKNFKMLYSSVMGVLRRKIKRG